MWIETIMSVNFREKKEISRCDICGGRLTVPPGVYYRGKVIHPTEAARLRRQEWDVEVKAPALTNIEQDLQAGLVNPAGTP